MPTRRHRGLRTALFLRALMLAPAIVLAPGVAQAQATQPWSWQADSPPTASYRQEPAFRQQPAAASASHTLLSLALPGLGQHRLGRSRKWLFLGLEVAAWAVYVERRSAGGSARDDYRDYAWQAGRVQAGPRVDSDFNYYETLSKWDRSGAFDGDAVASGVQPEEDPATFNGTLWARAQAIFLGAGGQPGDPAFTQALEYYQVRAYETDFLWDWSRTAGGRTQLGELISESDSRFRQATTALGVVIANHLVSAVDAFLVTRGVESRAGIDFAPRRTTHGSGWSARLRIPH